MLENLKPTGLTRHRVVRIGIWPFTRRDVLVLQYEMTGAHWHCLSDQVDYNVKVWRDAKPEWALVVR